MNPLGHVPLNIVVHEGAVDVIDTEELQSRLSQLLEDECPPGLSLAVVCSDGVLIEAHGGFACLLGTPLPVTATTAYDLASLTKVVCSTTLALLARQAGALAFRDPVQRWLPKFPRSDTSVLNLLTHTSGIVGHVPFFETLEGREAIETAVYAWAAEGAPGDTVLYSDLNFMLVGWLLEVCFSQPLDEAFRERLAAPLGLEHSAFCPPASYQHRTAATELDGDQRRIPGLVWGSVHDGNAFALGGVAGHAGLFSTLSDMSIFVRFLLGHDPDTILRYDSRRTMRTRTAATGKDVRGIGWRLNPSTWGPWPATTLWHTGFTGTSLLLSPALDLGIVLLTNAVHPRRQLDAQAQMRVTVHKLLADRFLAQPRGT